MCQGTKMRGTIFRVRGMGRRPDRGGHRGTGGRGLFFRSPFSTSRPFKCRGRFLLFFLFPPRSSQGRRSVCRGCSRVSVGGEVLYPHTCTRRPKGGVSYPNRRRSSRPGHYQRSRPCPISSFDYLAQGRASYRFRSYWRAWCGVGSSGREVLLGSHGM